MRLDRIATRVALAALVVAGVALAIVAVGVLRIGADAFASLMVAAGMSAEHAHSMFDESVAVVLVGAGAAAVAVALALAGLLGRRIAGPIERLASAAERTAAGGPLTKVAVEGPMEVGSLAAAYNTLIERLAEQEAIRREFVVNASHELRTPLTNLQGYLEALRDGVVAPEPAIFESLGEEVDRLTRLAASLDLLGGSDQASGPEPLDLAAAVRSAIELASPGFVRRSIAVEAAIGDPIEVTARPDEVAQVLANLLSNAGRYTPQGGTVRVEVEADALAPEAVVRVTNTGVGIPPEDLPHVWERFYRVEKSRDRASGGAGIGLAIVKRLVEEAGGRVGAASEAGATTFWFTLPRAWSTATRTS